MKKITLLSLFLSAVLFASAQIVNPVIKIDGFETSLPDGFASTFTTTTFTPTASGQQWVTSTGYTGGFWKDIWVDLPSGAIKDNVAEISTTEHYSGDQSLKITVTANTQIAAFNRIRTLAVITGGINDWTNYIITCYIKGDASSDGKQIFKSSTQTATTSWQKFTITSDYACRGSAQLRLDHPRRQLGGHRRGVRLQLGEGVAQVRRHALVEVAGHLAQLHEGALHVAELRRDLLRSADLVGPVEHVAPLRGREHPARPMADLFQRPTAAHRR
jgi:hypothetical protein